MPLKSLKFAKHVWSQMLSVRVHRRSILGSSNSFEVQKRRVFEFISSSMCQSYKTQNTVNYRKNDCSVVRLTVPDRKYLHALLLRSEIVKLLNIF